MKIRLLFLVLMIANGPVYATWQSRLDSPDGRLSVLVQLDERGYLRYQISHYGRKIIQPSPMGVRLDNTDFSQDLTLVAESPIRDVRDHYRLNTGKQSEITYHARELTLVLANPDGRSFVVRLRLSDDGLGYRYEFPGESEDKQTVVAEFSGVHFLSGTRAWLQHKANAQSGWKNTNPSYEEDYVQDVPVGTPSPTESGWVYPALFRYGGSWIVLSETGMDGHYSATNLAQYSDDGLYRVRFPQAAEVVSNGKVLPEAKLPFHSPWRLVLVGDLATIVNSTLGTDLAQPSVLENTGFARPGISAWSWGLLKDENTIYPVQKEFVDYAAQMNWPYVLVDADWDQKIGYEKIATLSKYAAGKGVGLLLWYNSSGNWNETTYSPKSRLLTRADRRNEFARLQSMGIKGVKVDFFPGDGMSVIRYYRSILEDAAAFGLMVNTHGSTLPRGLQRTYPNFMTSEAVKGLEMITFFQDAADREATHSAMLPFTRNLFDPMDFTPMVLGDIPNIERRTSNGFQLALPVLFLSGIQHLVTTPDQMAPMPEFVKDYLRHVPAQWDESRFIDGFPGKYVIIARRAGSQWYVAGINAEEQPKQLNLDLAFTGSSSGVLIADGHSRRDPIKAEFKVDDTAITLGSGSGFVIILDP